MYSLGKSQNQWWPAALFAVSLAFFPSHARAQQTYVTRFDMFAGYTFLDSPHVSLFENGFHYQAGVRATTWVSLGFDYSISAGNLTLTPNLLTTKLQQELSVIPFPPGYSLVVPVHSRTQTITGGPQFAYRHFSKVTLFVRPSVGLILERARPQPNTADPLATGIVKALVPSGFKTDNALFYGFGGGTDLILSKHVALRVQSDLVYDHLFDDLLKDGRWTVRFSVGPCFNFGKNIAKNVVP